MEMMTPYPDRNGLPRTGQTTSYRTGDDANLLAGDPLPRFVDLGNGLVRDRICVPNLYWPKAPHLMIPGAQLATVPSNTIQSAEGDWAAATFYSHGDLVSENGADAGPYYVAVQNHLSSDTFADDLANGDWVLTPWVGSAANLTTAGVMTWNDAIDDCLALTFAGRSDWRLANWKELSSLYDFEKSNSAWSDPLEFLSATELWSSTTRTILTTQAMTFTFGTIPTGSFEAKANTLRAIPVAGGVV